MKVVIFARGAYWSAADELMRAFVEQGIDCVMISLKTDLGMKRLRKEDLSSIYFCTKEGSNKKVLEWNEGGQTHINITRAQDILEEADRVICVPSSMIRRIERQLKNKPTVIVSTKYYKEKDIFEVRKKKPYPIFAVPSFIEYCPKGSYIFFPPYEFPSIDKTKDEKKVLVMHGLLWDTEKQIVLKGSEKIRRGIDLAKREVDFEYEEICKLPFWEAMTKKAKAHIFVDCLNSALGSGKSVWEAIALDSVIMNCSLRDTFVPNKFFPERFPIVDIRTPKDLANKLVELISDREKLNLEMAKVSEWKKYLSHKHVVEYFLSCWGI